MSKVLLMILDGWGIRKSQKYNSIKIGSTPYYDSLIKKYPTSVLKASGEAVGLPRGFMGNSEVGHTHLGAGKLISQDLMRINKAIKDKSFFKNKCLNKYFAKVKKEGKALHLMGLLSDGGVHSHINHLFALLKLAKIHDLKNVYVHCFTDGRDTPCNSGKKYIQKLLNFMKRNKIGEIASIIGRYYAMDRDKRWYRQHIAYDAIVNEKGRKFDNPIKAISTAYKNGETDEFIKPLIITKKDLVHPNDCFVFFNFRSDRARELTKAFTEHDFKNYKCNKVPVNFICLTQYDKKIKAEVVFLPHKSKNSLGEIMAKKNFKQLRIAETEKYAHVTFFFNGGRESPFPKEDRIVIPSPKVTTYDKKPEMSASKITKALLPTIGKYKLTVLNLANGDMVGHSGNLNATVKAVEYLDKCVKKIIEKCKKENVTVVVTADHGNCEEMFGKYKTTHTLNDVYCTIVSDEKYKLKNGCLYNIAPTILKIMKIKKPKDMAKSLF